MAALYSFLLILQGAVSIYSINLTSIVGSSNETNASQINTDENLEALDLNLKNYYVEDSPFMVAVVEETSEENMFHLCGGTLILHGWILTSRACKSPPDSVDVNKIYILESICNTSEKIRAHYVNLYITDSAYEYRPYQIRNDVALVKLEYKLSANKKRNRVDLASKKALMIEDFGGNLDICRFYFWPITKINPFKTDTHYLRYAHVNLIPRQLCRKRFSDTVISVGQICGTLFTGQTVPEEISGGPLVCKGVQCAFYTWKRADDKGEVVMIFTRVDYYQEYIKSVIPDIWFTDKFLTPTHRKGRGSIDHIIMKDSSSIIQCNILLVVLFLIKCLFL